MTSIPETVTNAFRSCATQPKDPEKVAIVKDTIIKDVQNALAATLQIMKRSGNHIRHKLNEKNPNEYTLTISRRRCHEDTIACLEYAPGIFWVCTPCGQPIADIRDYRDKDAFLTQLSNFLYGKLFLQEQANVLRFLKTSSQAQLESAHS